VHKTCFLSDEYCRNGRSSAKSNVSISPVIPWQARTVGGHPFCSRHAGDNQLRQRWKVGVTGTWSRSSNSGGKVHVNSHSLSLPPPPPPHVNKRSPRSSTRGSRHTFRGIPKQSSLDPC
jgi:hypothetical protein